MMYAVCFTGFGSTSPILGIFSSKAKALEAIYNYAANDKDISIESEPIEVDGITQIIAHDKMTNENEIFSFEGFNIDEGYVNY